MSQANSGRFLSPPKIQFYFIILRSSTTVNNIQVKFNTNSLGINGAMSAPVVRIKNTVVLLSTYTTISYQTTKCKV